MTSPDPIPTPSSEPVELAVGQEIHIPGHPAFEGGKPIRLRRMKVEDLHPAPYNPRDITDKAMRGLEHSLKKFGIADLPAWNEQSGLVVGGHQRLKVLRAEGAEDTLVVVKDLSDSDEKELNITLNNPHIAGEFTPELRAHLERIKRDAPDAFENLNLGQLTQDLKEIVRRAKERELLDAVPHANKQLEEDELEKTNHTCPNCGFKW